MEITKEKSLIEGLPISFSPIQMAKALGISKSYVYKIIKSGQIAHITVGTRKIILREDFISWLNRNRQNILNVD